MSSSKPVLDEKSLASLSAARCVAGKDRARTWDHLPCREGKPVPTPPSECGRTLPGHVPKRGSFSRHRALAYLFAHDLLRKSGAVARREPVPRVMRAGHAPLRAELQNQQESRADVRPCREV